MINISSIMTVSNVWLWFKQIVNTLKKSLTWAAWTAAILTAFVLIGAPVFFGWTLVSKAAIATIVFFAIIAFLVRAMADIVAMFQVRSSDVPDPIVKTTTSSSSSAGA